MSGDKKVCAVVGVGPGNGAAFAHRFAASGHQVALLARRTELIDALAAELGEGARAYACDVGDAASVQRAFSNIERELGDPDVVVYNAGSGVWGTIEDVSADAFETSWRINTLGAVHVAKAVVPHMKKKGRGAFVFIGATASRRGGAKAAAFASAKAAQRSLAESMARHLWPAGIHVSLIVIDGVVDLPETRKRMPDKPDAFFVRPAAVAEIALRLVDQDRSAWSFEVEARPFGEVW
jgi:NAD(P)-dependent dehydrogenase (short-subunit alcohol dehydrogenase family)